MRTNIPYKPFDLDSRNSRTNHFFDGKNNKKGKDISSSTELAFYVGSAYHLRAQNALSPDWESSL